MKSVALTLPYSFQAFQEGLYPVGVETAEPLGQAWSDARADGGRGARTLFSELKARPARVVGVDPPLDETCLRELGQCAADHGGVKTEVLHQPAGCVDTDLDSTQREEVDEVEVGRGGDVRARIGQHGLVQPKKGIEKPQLRRSARNVHPIRLAGDNY
jgi:hypothetical protein